MHLGVDAETFYPADEPAKGPVTLSYVGRTGIEKGPDLLLAAACSLAQRGRKFRISLIGSNHFDKFQADTFQRKLDQLIGELEGRGIEVWRPGHVARRNIPSEFRKSHIHVVPSRCDEAFGLTTLEGMATGLAVVASNVGGTPEVIGDAGMLFARESVDGLVSHLDKLICDEELRSSFARAARERASEFTWMRTWETLQRLVRV